MRWLNSPPAATICALAFTATTALSPLASAGAADTPPEWFTVVKPDPGATASPRPGPILHRSSRVESRIASITDSPDIPVNTASNMTQSENSVFVSPSNPSVLFSSNNASNWPVTTIYGADYWVSTDGGLTWTGGTGGTFGYQRGDPAAAINRNGRLFAGYIGYDYGQGVSLSDNNGGYWTRRTVALGPYILDKNHLWVDNSAASPYVDNVYSAWTNFQGGAAVAQIEFTRSTDGGMSWTSRQTLSTAVAAGNHNQGVNLQTGPNGEVYAVWAIYDCWPCDETALGFAKSLDGGQSFAPAQRILAGIRGHRATALGGEKTMRHNSYPSMSVDQQTGRIFVVWTNIGVPGVNTGDPDIYLIGSGDGGATWSTPVRVNQDPIRNGNDNYLPWISCDPVTGLLACIYYDSRNFPANDMVETFVAISTDHGLTWEDFQVSDVAWSGDTIFGFANGYAGDYLGIAARDNRVYPMWSDDRTGNMLAYLSPFTVPDLVPPIADFSGRPTSGPAPLAVQFTDLSTRGPTAWVWDFGDGGGSTLQHPSHTYTEGGSFTVTLTASDESGSDTESKASYVTVTTPPRMHVQSITLTRVAQGIHRRADARVTIVNQVGAPVAGATVGGSFNAPDSRTKRGTTDAAGVAVVSSYKTRTPPANWCFTVSDVSKSGQIYDPDRNVVTTGCESGAAARAIAATGAGATPLASALEPAEQADLVTSSRARIEFSLEVSSHVRVEVFDVRGRRIATLADEFVPAGDHAYMWDNHGAPSGIYFYRVRGTGLLKTGKILSLAR